MYGANKPNFAVIVGILNTLMNTLALYLYLAVFQLPTRFGITATAWIITCGVLPVNLLFMAISYAYVNKSIIPIKIPWKQISIGILIPACVVLALNYAVRDGIF